MTDTKKKGLDVSGGFRANQDGVGGGARVEYVYKNNKLTAVPYIEGSAYKGRKGKPSTSIDRMGVAAEYKPSKNTSIRGGVSTGDRGKDKSAGIEASYSFKKGGRVKKCKGDGCAIRGKTKGKMV